ncbi:hypothetical protein AB751O23_AH_00080 [Chlamydiales bacterium SCGC AB-751-O23]|nr:hypothetical protein AB751O23_AH_00080 [Chlamydiales bacterium SCGC AB-751-O23]
MFIKRWFITLFTLSIITFSPLVQGQLNAVNYSSVNDETLIAALDDKNVLRKSEGNIAVVLFVKGEAFAEDSDKTRFPLEIKSKLFEGDTIVTTELSLIQINFLDGSMIRLTGNGRMKLDQYTQTGNGLADANIEIEEGNFAVMVKKVSKLDHHHNYSVSTKSAKVSFKGTFGQGDVKLGGELNFVLVPENINGQVVHSHAVVQNLLSGQSASIGSDPMVGSNGVNIDRGAFQVRKVEVDIGELASNFGIAMDSSGAVNVASAATGVITEARINFEKTFDKEHKAEKPPFDESEKGEEPPFTDEPKKGEEPPFADEPEKGEEPPFADEAEKGEEPPLAEELERENRDEKREKIMTEMSDRREDKQGKRSGMREKIASGDIDSDEGLLGNDFFGMGDDDSSSNDGALGFFFSESEKGSMGPNDTGPGMRGEDGRMNRGKGMTAEMMSEPMTAEMMSEPMTPEMMEDAVEMGMDPAMMPEGMTPNMMAKAMTPEMMDKAIEMGVMPPGMTPELMNKAMDMGMDPAMMMDKAMEMGMDPNRMPEGMTPQMMGMDSGNPGMMPPGMTPEMMNQNMGNSDPANMGRDFYEKGSGNPSMNRGPEGMFSGEAGKSIIFESLSLLGFEEGFSDGSSYNLDFSDVGFELDKELAESIFIEEMDMEDMEDGEKGSAFGVDAIVEGASETSENASEFASDDSFIGEDGSFLVTFAKQYIDKATDRIDVIPGQEGVDPVGLITERTKGEFSRFFHDAISKGNLNVPGGPAGISYLEEDMWREFHAYFLPHFIQEYKHVLEGLRGDETFFLTGNPLDKIAVIEQGFLAEMSDQADVFSKDFFHSAFAFYTEQFDNSRLFVPEDQDVRGKDFILIGRDYTDFPEFNYAEAEHREPLSGNIEADANKFVGAYINTREAPGKPSIPFIKALNDLSLFQKEAANPFLEDDFEELRSSMGAVKSKVEEVDDLLNGDWSKVEKSSLDEIRVLVEASIEKTNIATGNIPLANDARRQDLEELRDGFLNPMLFRLQEDNNLYLGIDLVEKDALADRLSKVKSDINQIKAFVNSDIDQKNGVAPAEMDFAKLSQIEGYVNSLDQNIASLENELHPDDPLALAVKDFRQYSDLANLGKQLKEIREAGQGSDSLPPELLFESFGVARQLLKITDKVDGYDINFIDIEGMIANNISQVGDLGNSQGDLRVDFFDFFGNDFQEAVRGNGVIDNAIGDLDAGDSFALPEEAILDLDITVFREDVQEVQMLTRELMENGLRVNHGNRLRFLKLNKSLENLNNRYDYLSETLPADHPLKMKDLDDPDRGKTWIEMGNLLAVIQTRIVSYVAAPNLVAPDDEDFLNLQAFLMALDETVISNFLDERDGKSVLDLATGGSTKNEAIRPAGVRKGNMVVLNKKDFYEENGEFKEVREISYLGKEVADEEVVKLTGIKKFSSQFDKYRSLPELMTSMLAYEDNDKDSLTFDTDGVVDFGSDQSKAKGFISFFIPSFRGGEEDGDTLQEVPEIGFDEDPSRHDVGFNQPIMSPSAFAGYEVKSTSVSQNEFAFVEEGDLLMVLKKDPVPAGTYLDMNAVLTEEGLGVPVGTFGSEGLEGFVVEEYLISNNEEVVKGQQVIALVRSNADIPVEHLVVYPNQIPSGYKVKELSTPQNEAVVVEKGDLLMVLEHEDPELRAFHGDIEIRADLRGNFIGSNLEVGTQMDGGVKVGDLTGIENFGETRIILATDEAGIFKQTLQTGDVVNYGENIGRITVTSNVEFEDIFITADRSGVYQGLGLKEGDEIASMQLLGEFIEDVENDLQVDFLETKVSEDMLLFGRYGESIEMEQDPRAAMVFYFDEESGEKKLYQMTGFGAANEPDDHFEEENMGSVSSGSGSSSEMEDELKTPLISDVTDFLVFNDVEFIGETISPGDSKVDGLAINAKGIGKDVQLLSASFSDLDQHLVHPDGVDESSPVQQEYFGFANGFLVNVNDLSSKIDNWFVSPSKLLRLPVEFSDDGAGEFYETAQLELASGVDFRFGRDVDQANMVVDREHVLSSFESASGDGILMTFPLPNFSSTNDYGGIGVAKPGNVMWGAWDVDAVTGLEKTTAVMPGLHNYWAAGTPTSASGVSTTVGYLSSVDKPIMNYEVMVAKSFISGSGLEDDALVSSEGGIGEFFTDFENSVWQSMVYFSDGYLLVGKGGLEGVSLKNSSGEGMDATGFDTSSEGWTLIDLMGSKDVVHSNLSNPSLVNSIEDSSGIGSMKGFFVGEDMSEVVITASAQEAPSGDQSGDAATIVGVGSFASNRANRGLGSFVGFMDGVLLGDEEAELKSNGAFFNFDDFGLMAKSQKIDPSILPDTTEELNELLEVNPFINVDTLEGGSPETVEMHNWVEVRETFKTARMELPDSEVILERMLDGSAVTIGDVLLSAESGLEIMSSTDGTVFFHNGRVPGSTLTANSSFATVVSYEGGDIVDGLFRENTKFSEIIDGSETKGALTLITQDNETNPLGVLDLNGSIYEQGRVILKTSSPSIKYVPELTVEYRVKVDELVSSVEKNDRPFYVRLLLVAPDGSEFAIELPKLDISGVDGDGYVDFLFDSADSLEEDVVIYNLHNNDSPIEGNLADFLDESASDTGLRDILNMGIITEVSLIYGGDIEVEGELHIDSITVSNLGKEALALSDDFEGLIGPPQDLIFMDKDAFYIAPATMEEARLYLPAIEGMDPVDGTGFIATLKGLEDFEYLSFGLWKSQYQDQSDSEIMDAAGFFAVGNADHVYTRSDHDRYLEALRQFNLPQVMNYSGLSVGAVYGPGRDGRIQVGTASLNIDMFSGATNGSIQLGIDSIDLQTGSLEELRKAFGGGGVSNGMGFSGTAELRINGEAASGRIDLGDYQGALFGKYNSDALNAAKEAAGTYKATNNTGTHRAVGAFGVKKK